MQSICVAGKNEIAIEGLKYIIENRPDLELFFIPNKNDSGDDGWQPSFKKYALGKGVKQVALEDVYSIDELVFLSLEFDRIIKPERFKTKNLFNIHFSKLPKYKGMYTSAMPLLNGEEVSGVTFHRIDAGIDTGDIIGQIEFYINPKDNARDLYFKYLANSKKLFNNYIELILSGRFLSVPQASQGASYYSRSAIDYSCLRIDFNKCAIEVSNQFRAFTFREYQIPNFAEWGILTAEVLSEKSQFKPGVIVSEDDLGFIVSTIDYDVFLKKDYYPMFWRASEAGDIDALEFSLNFIDDVDSRNNKGWSALILAAYHGKIDVVEKLLNAGASVSVVGYNGTTPLMYAFSYYERHGDDQIFRILIGRGANVSVRDNAGKSLKDYMISRGCLGLIQYV